MKKFTLLIALLPLTGWAAASTTPVDITAAQLEVIQAKGIAVFSGDVHAVQGTLTLNAPKVTVTYSKDGKDGDIQEIRATGGVTITRGTNPPEKATGTEGVYNPQTQQLVLTGVVELTRGPSTLAGDKLLYDIPTGNAKVTNSAGPVKAHFTPGSK